MANKPTEAEIILSSVTEEEYELAGSKFMTFIDKDGKIVQSGEWKGHIGEDIYLEVESGMPDWDTPGKSLKFPITVVEEGPDKGKADKISTGVDSKSIWKLKEVVKALTGKDLQMKKGGDGKAHPVLNPTEFVGKPAIAHYQLIRGKKGGVATAEDTIYHKLIELLPTGEKPNTESLM